MERQALFLNSALTIFLWSAGCNNNEADIKIPDAYVVAGHKSLHQKTGYLLYNNKRFSGHTYELYANGDTALLFSYYNGKEEGWCYKWFTGKLKMEERFFVNGRKEGTHKSWWKNGQPRFEYHFTNDEHEGAAKEFFNNGKAFRIFHYRKGHEDGLQQLWWEDGKIRANYVVKNGEQYGLIGRKLCKNVTNEKN